MVSKWKILAVLAAAAVTLAAGGCAGKAAPAVEETTAAQRADRSVQETAAPAQTAERDTVQTSADESEEEVWEREDTVEKGPDAGLNAVQEEEDLKGNVEAFAELVQEAVADRDMEAFADLIFFPVTLHTTDGEALTFQDREEFSKQNPDLIFGDDLMMAVANVDTAILEKQAGGVTMGEGTAFLRLQTAEDGTLGIVEIRE